MEKEIEEHLAPKEGEEALDEETKQLEARKLRFKIMSRLFFSMEIPEVKKKKKEEKLLE